MVASVTDIGDPWAAQDEGLRMTLSEADGWLVRQDVESPLRRSFVLAEAKAKGRVREPVGPMFITVFYAGGLYDAHVREGVSPVDVNDIASPLIVDCSCGWSATIPATRDEYGDAERAHFAHVEASSPVGALGVLIAPEEDGLGDPGEDCGCGLGPERCRAAEDGDLGG